MIRTAAYTPADRAAFLDLYRACLSHYGVGPASDSDERRIGDLLDSERHMSCLMAWKGADAVGFATWTLTFPAGTGCALYLKELFVTKAARGTGAGKALLSGLIRIAEEEQCTRFDWQTDGTNAASQAFYAALDAPRFDKVSYRIDRADFAAMRSRLG